MAICGLAAAEVNPPVATVRSRAPFSVQGVSVPVVGGTAWPVAAGDMIETKSAPAEISLKDGTRIFVPAGSRFVVAGAQAGNKGLRVNLSGSQEGARNVSKSAPSSLSKGAVNIFDLGMLAAPAPVAASSSAGRAPKVVDGSAPATLSLFSLLQTFGVNTAIVGTIDQALTTKNASLQFDAASNTYYVTGIQATVGNSAPQTVTFVISPTQIVVASGTVTPGAPPPTPLVTVTPGAPSPCKGSSVKPADVSNSVVSVPTGGSC